MHYEIMKLQDYYKVLKPETDTIFEPTLIAYCPDNTTEVDINRKRPSIIICPGGGYEFLSDREAEPIALRFMSFGYNAFVLRYSIRPEKHPHPLLEAAAAAAIIRKRAKEFNADTDQIAICGFSAGGHVAASLGVFWNADFVSKALETDNNQFKPNAMILSYPVISSGEFAHRGSFDNLVGTDADQSLLDKVSLEKQVHDLVPPAFIWHTFNDDCVPVENTLMFAAALRKHKVPFELHIYPEGFHGLSLCEYETSQFKELENPHAGTWISLCREWMTLIFGNTNNSSN